MRPLRLALIGPLTPLGRALRLRLEEASLVVERLRLIGEAAQAGTLGEYAGEALIVEELSAEALEGADAVLLAGPGEKAAEVRGALPPGARLLDLTGSLPLDRETLLYLPGRALAEPGPRHATRIAHPLSLALTPILAALGEVSVLRADVIFLEAVGARGEPAVDELHAQAVALLRFETPPVEVLDARLAFSLAPWPRPAAEALGRRVRDELHVLLAGAAPALALVALHAPVFLGSAVLLQLEVEEEELAAQDLREALEGIPGLRWSEDPVRPGELPDSAEARLWVSPLPAPGPGRLALWCVYDALRGATAGAALAWLEGVAEGARGR